MPKKFMDKIKEGVSVQEVEDFARKYTTEVFSVLAIVIASISSMYDFFTGPKFTIIFIAIGLILGVFFPSPVEKGLKQFYNFSSKQEKMTQMVLGLVHIVVGLFIPFILFGFIGLLAGTAYHYYTRHAQSVTQNSPPKPHNPVPGEEHD